MIPSLGAQSYDNKIGITGEAMSVIMDEKSAHTLSSVIYSNHRRIEAVIRELCTNAYDSHIKAGNEDVPIVVTLPTLGYPYLSIQDSGVGLSKEDGEVFFGTYFASGSQFEEKPTGYYGLGAKSPHSYTDAYEITMVKDGLKNIMLCFKNEHGVPAYNVLTANEPTDEPNGVCFKVGVRESDFRDFHKAAYCVLPMFATQPIVINAEKSLKASMQAMKKCQDDLYDLDGVSAMIFSWETMPSPLQAHPSKCHLMVRMGNILYHAHARSLVKSEVISRSGFFFELYEALRSSEIYMLLEVDIATHGMTVEPGRENIITNAKNMATLESLCERVVKRLKSEVKAKYSGKTPWQVSRKIMQEGGFDKLKESQPDQYLKACLYGAGPYLIFSDISGLMDRYKVNISIVRASHDFSKTSSISASRFMSVGHGLFNPSQIRNIVVHDDRSLKVGVISSKLRDIYMETTSLKSFQQRVVRPYKELEVLGVIIRGKNKLSDVEGFARALFGQGEYTMASDLMSRNIDISDHERLMNSSVKHYIYNHYISNIELLSSNINLFKLKSMGRLALQKRWQSTPMVCMTQDEFEKSKDEITRLFHQSGSSSQFSIMVTDMPADEVPHATTINNVLERAFRYTDIERMIKQKVIGVLIHQALSKEGASSRSCLISSYQLIQSVVSNKTERLSVYRDTDDQIMNTIRRTPINCVETPENNVKELTDLLYKYGIGDNATLMAAYKESSSKERPINEMISNIIELFRKKPLEACFYFDVSKDTLLNLKDSLLSGITEINDIESMLRSIADKNTNSQKEAA